MGLIINGNEINSAIAIVKDDNSTNDVNFIYCNGVLIWSSLGPQDSALTPFRIPEEATTLTFDVKE